MLEKLVENVRRFEEIERQLNSADPSKIGALMKEYGKLQKYAVAYRELQEIRARIEDSKKVIASENDADLRTLAEQELHEAAERERAAIEKIEEMILEGVSFADRDVIMEIRPGVGGDEAALFAGDLYRMYTKYFERRGWKVELLDLSSTDLKGIRSVVMLVEGENAYKHLKFEGGPHRVQRVPRTEASGRLHTSAATVVVLPQADEVDIDLKKEELKIDTACSGGPGGQHVNKTESKVIITHVPTGITVYSQSDRSQHRNRELAMALLRTKLLEHKMIEQTKEMSQMRKGQIGSGDRSERIRTYNFPQNRLTDHRIDFTSHRLGDILEGDMDELIAALIEAERKKRLESFK